MSIPIRVDPSSTLPPYEQVAAEVDRLVAEGALSPGDRLPTVRALAADLDLATNTVAKAYRALESAGTVTTRGRAGTVVSDTTHAARARAAAAAGLLAVEARTAGLTDAEAVGLVRDALRGTGAP
ncbi:GntR family transcriptional regulator [Paraoerskovia sediminicola]|uniref:GntR family transcriptional regulator n=1 Tax=Paraoerskovia sediminicola TaxID=1138587 RepID=A0ABM8G006_9CELL|nr:GntR family transcriptional regulator [Paraoerskovia sediminicola]BDZ41225.1 GntR family transcriptional regulator [Paraoerskovia sediminicola]